MSAQEMMASSGVILVDAKGKQGGGKIKGCGRGIICPRWWEGAAGGESADRAKGMSCLFLPTYSSICYQVRVVFVETSSNTLGAGPVMSLVHTNQYAIIRSLLHLHQTTVRELNTTRFTTTYHAQLNKPFLLLLHRQEYYIISRRSRYASSKLLRTPYP
jgi:hypothetical protein